MKKWFLSILGIGFEAKLLNSGERFYIKNDQFGIRDVYTCIGEVEFIAGINVKELYSKYPKEHPLNEYSIHAYHKYGGDIYLKKNDIVILL